MDGKRSAYATVTLALTLALQACGETATRTPVEVAPVASVSIDPVSTQLIPGATVQLIARALGPSGEAVPGSSFAYSTDNNSVASVSQSGLVTLIGPGTVTVAASTAGRTGTREIIVNYPVPTLTGITPTSVSTGVASSISLRGTGFYAGTVVQLNGATRSSTRISDGEVRVDFGAADFAATGVALVRVFNPAPGGGTSGTISLTVRATVASISIDPVFPQLMPGARVQLFARALSASGESLPGFTFTYSAGNQEVASVSPTGLLTSIGPGTVVVTAAASGRTGTREIIVNYPIPTLTSIAPVSLPMGVAASITVRGSAFYAGTVVRLNGVTKPTLRISDSELIVTFTAVDLATSGPGAVTVFSPAPGGGTSTALALTVLGATACNVFASLTTGTTVTGRLDTTDCSNGSSGALLYNDVYNFTTQAPMAVTFTLTSSAFSPFLALRDTLNQGALYASAFASRPQPAVLNVLLPARTFAVSAGTVDTNAAGGYTLASTVSSAPTITGCAAWFVVPPMLLTERVTKEDCGLAPHHRVAPNNSSETLMHEYYWDAYHLILLAGQTVTITMTSMDFEPAVVLYNANDTMIMGASGGAVGLNARITFTAGQTGAFRIDAGPQGLDGKTGAYTIRVE